MRRASFSHWPCSMARTADLVGDPWTSLVLREAFYGTRRFDEFRRELGIARNTLTDRLRRLVDEGMLERHLYANEPIRHEYVLTDKGADFWNVLLAMSAWGDRWLADDAGPPVTMRHTACGHETRARVVCEHCGEAMPIEETRMSFGPGYPVRLRERPDVKARFDRMSRD